MQMFMFGTKALEQFMDRLVEWPQYCNHILQISHLRGTHSDLVSFIERALTRISSSQSESSSANSISVDQQQGSGAPNENMEVCLGTYRHVLSLKILPCHCKTLLDSFSVLYALTDYILGFFLLNMPLGIILTII